MIYNAFNLYKKVIHNACVLSLLVIVNEYLSCKSSNLA